MYCFTVLAVQKQVLTVLVSSDDYKEESIHDYLLLSRDLLAMSEVP